MFLSLSLPLLKSMKTHFQMKIKKKRQRKNSWTWTMVHGDCGVGGGWRLKGVEGDKW